MSSLRDSYQYWSMLLYASSAKILAMPIMTCIFNHQDYFLPLELFLINRIICNH